MMNKIKNYMKKGKSKTVYINNVLTFNRIDNSLGQKPGIWIKEIKFSDWS